MPFVVDNSVIVGWYLDGQRTEYTESVFDRLATDTAHVPALWPLEFSNVLRKAVLGRKIGQAEAEEIAALQTALPVVVHADAPALSDNLELALRYGLSSYDAAYLDLALRLRLPVATLDASLRRAAEAAGVGVVDG